MSKFKKMILTVLVVSMLAGGILASTIAAETPEEVVISINQSNIDLSADWTIEEFSTNLAGVTTDMFFKQEDISWGNTVKGTFMNFGNIGKAKFKATKSFPLKAGVTYKINLGYGMFYEAPPTGGPFPWSASINFNGHVIEVTDTLVTFGKEDGANSMYSEEITPSSDMDYVITQEFDVPARSNLYLQLGYYTNDIDGGIKETYAMNYDANNATSGTAPRDTNLYVQNEEATLPMANDLERDGYNFVGWNTRSDGLGISYAEGDIFSVQGNTTFFANWEPKSTIPEVKYTVTYANNGATNGQEPKDLNEYSRNDIVSILDGKDLVREGYEFHGWSTRPDGSGASYNYGDQVIAKDLLNVTKASKIEVTLYAQWKVKKTDTNNNSTSSSQTTQGDTNKNASIKTSDQTNISLMITLLLVSSLSGIILIRRKYSK